MILSAKKVKYISENFSQIITLILQSVMHGCHSSKEVSHIYKTSFMEILSNCSYGCISNSQWNWVCTVKELTVRIFHIIHVPRAFYFELVLRFNLKDSRLTSGWSVLGTFLQLSYYFEQKESHPGHSLGSLYNANQSRGKQIYFKTAWLIQIKTVG